MNCIQGRALLIRLTCVVCDCFMAVQHAARIRSFAVKVSELPVHSQPWSVTIDLEVNLEA